MGITEDYVSFETAKLLKEKGFDIPCRQFLNPNGKLWFSLGNGDINDGSSDWNSTTMEYTSVPTLQMAMKWIRKVGIFIEIDYDSYETEDGDSVATKTGYSFSLQKKEKPGDYEYIHDWVYDTYEEAVEESIKFCLTNYVK